MRRPNFFIVGAPKCGTTALRDYLAQHPEIFMANGEPAFFCPDLDPARRPDTATGANDPAWLRHGEWLHPGLDPWEVENIVRTDDAYASLFAEATEAHRAIGEKSTQYIYSQEAPAKIRDFDSGAKVIIMLRDPVEMVYSLHGELLGRSDEDIVDFEAALTAEADRRAGRRVPNTCVFPWLLFYTDVGKYAEHVRRYLEAFPEQRVLVVLFDDFKKDTTKVYREVLRFLEVDPDVTLDFAPVNVHTRVRSPKLQALLGRRTAPRFVYRIARSPLLYPAVSRLRGLLQKANRHETKRTPLRPAVVAGLRREFASDVRELEKLLGRDLSAWRPS